MKPHEYYFEFPTCGKIGKFYDQTLADLKQCPLTRADIKFLIPGTNRVDNNWLWPPTKFHRIQGCQNVKDCKECNLMRKARGGDKELQDDYPLLFILA